MTETDGSTAEPGRDSDEEAVATGRTDNEELRATIARLTGEVEAARSQVEHARQEALGARERLARRRVDLDRDDLPRPSDAVEVDDLVVARAPAQPRRIVARKACRGCESSCRITIADW